MLEIKLHSIIIFLIVTFHSHDQIVCGPGVESRTHLIYHLLSNPQATLKNPNTLLVSLSLPTPPPETVFFGGLPQGAIEAIKAAYGVVLQILDPPRDGFNLTLKLNLSKLPPNEGPVSFLV